MDHGWYAYQCNTGDILFFYNKFSEEYRWLSCQCTKQFKDVLCEDKPKTGETPSKCNHVRSVGTETDTIPPNTKEFKTQGTQTDLISGITDLSLDGTNTITDQNLLKNTVIQPERKQERTIHINARRRETNDALHVQRHKNINSTNNVKLFPCAHCNKAFTSFTFLSKHLKCHGIDAKHQVYKETTDEENLNEMANYGISDEESIGPLFSFNNEVLVNPVDCYQCDKKFRSLESLDEHFSIHYDDLHCYSCDKDFGCTKSFRMHIVTHFGENHQCPLCRKKYPIKLGLLRHIKQFHNSIWNDRLRASLIQLESLIDNANLSQLEEETTPLEQPQVTFTCDVCKISFGLYSDLVHHQMSCRKPQVPQSPINDVIAPSSNDESPTSSKSLYWCEKCDLYYKTKKSLVRHKRVSKIHRSHSYPKKPKMDTSSIGHPTSPSLKANNHTFYCLDCGQSFQDYQLLKDHKTSQSCSNSKKLENNKFQCIFCSEICVSRVQLCRHLVTHTTADKNGHVSCNQCTKRFKDKDTLERHLYNHLSSYKCHQCNLEFETFKSFKKHNKITHFTTSMFTCSICNQKFVGAAGLVNHYKVHKQSGSCSVCGKSFHYKKNLKSHERKCKNINKVFAPLDTQNNNTEKEHINMDTQGIDLNANTVIKKEVDDTLSQDMGSQNVNESQMNEQPQMNEQSRMDEQPQMYKLDKASPNSNTCPNLRNRKLLNQPESNFIKKEKQYQCLKCKKRYSNKYSLARHQVVSRHGDYRKDNHIKKRYKCTVCKKAFQHYSIFYQHQKLHTGKNKCRTCGQCFSSRKLLAFHKCKNYCLTTETSKVYQCHMCEQKYHTGQGLSNHLRGHRMHIQAHVEETKLRCDCCNREFENIHRLKKHLTTRKHARNLLKQKETGIVNETKMFECSQCGKFYSGRKQLMKHKRRHHISTPVPIIKCQICKEQFDGYKLFEDHFSNKHTQAKPCWLCEKSFANYSNLTRHVKDSHHEEKRFICHNCSAEFSTFDKYIKHVSFSSRAGGYRHQCKKCGASFGLCIYLLEHIATCHT